MKVQLLNNFVMDDICHDESEAYQLAFYGVPNSQVEDYICANTEQTNCRKYRIYDLHELATENPTLLPDVIVILPGTILSPEDQQLLTCLNISTYLTDSMNFNDSKDLESHIANIQKSMYSSKVSRNYQWLKKEINSIEKSCSSHGEAMVDEIIDRVVALFAAKDNVTYLHVLKVSEYVDIFQNGLNGDDKLADQEIAYLKKAALIHDIGKLIIPNQILRKKTRLTPIEFAIMKMHVASPVYLFEKPSMMFFRETVLSHHERFDGMGYPNGLARNNIPYYARLLSVLDTFEALTGKREYVKKQNIESLDQVMEIIRAGAGTQFDPEIVQIFERGVYQSQNLLEGLFSPPGESLK